MSIAVNVQGIPAAQTILQAVPTMTPAAVKATLQQIEGEAQTLMKDMIRDSIRNPGEKSFGGLEASVETALLVDSSNSAQTTGVLEVGSRLAYAGLAASDIKQTTFNRVVYLNPPGKFRYMGVRKEIAKHPFLEQTRDALIPIFLTRFGTNLLSMSADIQTKADSLQLAGLASMRFQRSQKFQVGVGE